MKFRFQLSSNREAVPFDYPYQLCGVFHRLVGPNKLHDLLSLYSLGWLHGGQAHNGSLEFRRGASWEIGIWDDELAERLIRGALVKKFSFYGMKIRRVDRLPTPDFSKGVFVFSAGSPVFIRRMEDDYTRTHLTYDDPDHKKRLRNVLLHKMDEAGLGKEHRDFKIEFDRNYRNPQTKLVDIKGIQNRASICPVVMQGTVKALEFAWTVGVGELTGTGFGSLVGRPPYSHALDPYLEAITTEN